jgi:hypothetical protein
MVVVCARCGQKNQVPDMPRTDGLYRCGSFECRAVLAMPFPRTSSVHPTKTEVRLACLLLGVVVVTSLFYAVRFSGSLEHPSLAQSSKPSPATPGAVVLNGPAVRPPVPQSPLGQSQGTQQGEHNAGSPSLSLFDEMQTEAFRKLSQQEQLCFMDWYRYQHAPTGPQSLSPVKLKRPLNGANIVSPQGPRGPGSLIVENGTDHDAAIKLVYDTVPIKINRFVYVRSKEKAVVGNIGQGTYLLRFSAGMDWGENCWGFFRDADHSQFADPLHFTEIRTAEGTTYATYKVTLHPVPEGQAKTHTIDKSVFEEGDEDLRKQLEQESQVVHAPDVQ